MRDVSMVKMEVGNEVHGHFLVWYIHIYTDFDSFSIPYIASDTRHA